MQRLTAVLLLILTAVAVCACEDEYQGEPPDYTRLSYPISAAVSSDGKFLLVTSSNYDLKYSSGYLSVYDLDKKEFLSGTGAGISSFPGKMLMQKTPDGEGEAGYIAVREDRSLTWFRFDESGAGDPVLECGADDAELSGTGLCSGEYTVTEGYDALLEEPSKLGADPFLVKSTTFGGASYLIVGTLGSGTLELLKLEPDGRPVAIDRRYVAEGLSSIAIHPSGAIAACSRFSSRIFFVGLKDEGGSPVFDFQTSVTVPLGWSATDYCRGLAFVSSGRRLLALFRSPALLVSVDTSSLFEAGQAGNPDPRLLALSPLGRQASGLELLPTGAAGAQFLYLINYGDDSVLVIDPESLVPVRHIPVHLAPFDLAYNPVRKEGYVVNFEGDSVSVLDLDPASATYHQVRGELK